MSGTAATQAETAQRRLSWMWWALLIGGLGASVFTFSQLVLHSHRSFYLGLAVLNALQTIAWLNPRWPSAPQRSVRILMVGMTGLAALACAATAFGPHRLF